MNESRSAVRMRAFQDPAGTAQYVIELHAEVERLREALTELCGWAEAARGHYGIEECGGPGRARTEWDEIQDGLRDTAAYAREVLSLGAPSDSSDGPAA